MNFTISQVIFMYDIMREDQIRYIGAGGEDVDVLCEYEMIISALKKRIDDHNGFTKAVSSLLNQPQKALETKIE